MKRKSNCLIEELENSRSPQEHYKPEKKSRMRSPKEWFALLQDAEKTSVLQDKIQKVHYKFNDNKEMVEEYNVDTYVVIRRAWKIPGKLGEEKKWEVEVGIPEPKGVNNANIDDDIIRESSDQPSMERRNTRVNLEWRIRNLPYPIETYSVAANTDERNIVIKTTNKKFYKKLTIPELDRIGVAPVQANVEYTHKYNTLIVTYKKPKELVDLEKQWVSEVKKLQTKESIGDCKPS